MSQRLLAVLLVVLVAVQSEYGRPAEAFTAGAGNIGNRKRMETVKDEAVRNVSREGEYEFLHRYKRNTFEIGKLTEIVPFNQIYCLVSFFLPFCLSYQSGTLS